MKRFLISIAAILALATTTAKACGYEDQSMSYYMFSYCDNSFSANYSNAMNKFWQDYCKKDYCPGIEELIKTATRKNDTPMKIYLQYLKKYDDVQTVLGDRWDYPTEAQIAQSKKELRSIVSTAAMNLKGKYGNRWALLLMRANMCLNDHQANIAFYNKNVKQYANDCYKDMMRNIYARDLLLTGKKQEAWNIYAEQNDQQSLLWSVRKFTNLAGIKTICAEDANAPVLNFLVQTYVNRIQALIEESSGGNVEEGYEVMPYLDFRNVIWGKAYAQVSANQKKEFNDFIAFAKQMANGGKTNVPCMWMSAASLVNYFMEDYKEAKSCIDKAMGMKGTEAMKNNARRIRMLVEPTVADIKSESFKSFMATELRWLDSQVKGDESSAEAEARERIIRHGLAELYKSRGDENLHIALCAVTDFHGYDRNSEWYGGRFDYSSPSFRLMDKMTAKEIGQYFAMIDGAADPLAQYLSEKLSPRYNANFRNDLIGTKLLAENRLADALPYLKKVDMKYLESQAISYFAAHRNFKKPYWEGLQLIGAPMWDDNGELRKNSLKSNVKVDFCNEVVALLNQYGIANNDARKNIAYQLANCYYQASYKGRCWYITHYGQSVTDEQNPKEANFPELARKYLAEAASSTDANLKMTALFAQVSMAPDEWVTYDYDENYDLVPHIQRGSKQYASLKALDSYTREVGFEKSFISKCDVIKQFRKSR